MVKSIVFGKPKNNSEWNSLCKSNSNVLQTTYYDQIQKFYNNNPIYFDYRENGILIAGVKIYNWKSNKIKFLLPKITNSYTQFGEFIVHPNYYSIEIIEKIKQDIKQFLKEENAVKFRSICFYGKKNLIYDVDTDLSSKSEFDVAVIDTTNKEDELLRNMHSKHRNVLKKAYKSNLVFEETDDINTLISTMKETYSNQIAEAPNFDYIKKAYSILKKHGCAKIFLVRDADKVLSVAFVQIYGDVADYTFGGNKRNSLGSGQFLQWNIIKYLKAKNISNYFLGQVAKEIDSNNLKFSKGITKFKMRFGCNRLEGSSYSYIYKPLSLKIFTFMQKSLLK